MDAGKQLDDELFRRLCAARGGPEMQEIRALRREVSRHQAGDEMRDPRDASVFSRCEECGRDWPCPTIVDTASELSFALIQEEPT